MKTGMDKQAQLIAWLNATPAIELAILFGSYARGRATANSDIDVAMRLVSGKAMTAPEKLDYVLALQCQMGCDVDLIDLTTVGQPLLSEIIKHGHLLKGSASQYADLAIKNINTTEDFMPAIDRMILERAIESLKHRSC